MRRPKEAARQGVAENTANLSRVRSGKRKRGPYDIPDVSDVGGRRRLTVNGSNVENFGYHLPALSPSMHVLSLCDPNLHPTQRVIAVFSQPFEKVSIIRCRSNNIVSRLSSCSDARSYHRDYRVVFNLSCTQAELIPH